MRQFNWKKINLNTTWVMKKSKIIISFFNKDYPLTVEINLYFSRLSRGKTIKSD